MGETSSEIYFARSHQLISGPPDGSIVVCAANDNWNDFGLQTLFDFSIVNGSKTNTWRRFSLAFLDSIEEKQSVIVDKSLSNNDADLLPASMLPKFYSMQLGMADYAEIIRELGLDVARRVLAKLNDVVVAASSTPVPDWFEQAIRSEAFNLSFLRSSRSFNAFFNARQLLAGNVVEAERPPTAFSIDFKLDEFVGSHHFEFRFDINGLLPKRIAVIVGKNGVGKSRTLNELANAVIFEKDNLRGDRGQKQKFGRVIAVCTPGETESTFPPTESSSNSVEYMRLLALPGQRVQDGEGTLPLVLQQLARTDAMEDGAHRWQIFKKAISAFIPFSSLTVIPRKPANSYAIPPELFQAINAVELDDISYGGEKARLEAAARLDRSGTLVRKVGARFVPLSSGQLSFLRLAAQLCLYIRPGTLVLIDEPETHLHPNLITDFVVLLNDILTMADSIAIVATHSSYLVREVPTSQVRVIRISEDNFVEIGMPRIKTFGADVGSISNFIFEDGFINRLSDEVDLRIKQENLSMSEWLKILEGELSDEAIMYLKRRQGVQAQF